MSDSDQQTERCGFVALLGAPNAGKSTLMNCLVGAKVSIVTHKVQTTRMRIRAVALQGASQIVFVDTPGIFGPKRRLDRSMVAAAWAGAEDADRILLLYDAQRSKIDGDTRQIIDGLRERGLRADLVLNKIDLVPRNKLLALAAKMDAEKIFEKVYMVSALNGDGTSDLLSDLAAVLPAGPWLYPEDQLSDLSLRLSAAELTREKLFLSLHQELPYGLTVETEKWEDFDNGDVRLSQVIYLARESHKGICLGKRGERIKAIREEVQKELQEALDCKVHLFIFVKVRENWQNDPERYQAWGLDFDA